MSLMQLKTADLGKTRSGLSGSVGYTLYNTVGVEQQARTQAGIYEVTASSGIYASFIAFPDGFNGSIMWDSGQAGNQLVFAVEQYNYEENNPNVDLILSTSLSISSSISSITASNAELSSSLESMQGDVTFISNTTTDISQSLQEVSSSVDLIDARTTAMNVTLGTISVDVTFIKDIEGGRWKIDTGTNQMVFYKDDNSTVVARFNLFDSSSNPTSIGPFERSRV